jgi:glycosyltransferase involved in cell wall biosynthesis
MTKNKTVKYEPFVSIICVTYNRRPFMETFFQCIRNQDYPKSRFECIILDDSDTDAIGDLVLKANIPQLKYFHEKTKMPLGKKRNHSHTLIDPKSKYIIYFDDDDYHHPERISHSIEMLEKHPNALCAGASELYVYFKHISKMYQFGPYGPNHATAGTFCFRRKLLEISKYDDNACLAEEKAFLKDYTIPFLQLDPMKTILVISHNHNTFDKKKLLIDPYEKYTKESAKTVSMFISRKNEVKIKKFFLDDIDDLLKDYDLGESKHKPDVLKQIEEIEMEREKMRLQSQNNNYQIMIERPGEGAVALSQQEVIQLLMQQKNEIEFLKKHVKELDEKNQVLLKQLLAKRV